MLLTQVDIFLYVSSQYYNYNIEIYEMDEFSFETEEEDNSSSTGRFTGVFPTPGCLGGEARQHWPCDAGIGGDGIGWEIPSKN